MSKKISKKLGKKIVGIDPGVDGMIAVVDGRNLEFFGIPYGPDNRVDVKELFIVLRKFKDHPIFLERAMPLAMGAKYAFNYGKDFAAIEICLLMLKASVVQVEPSKWGKVMHQGIDANLKSKAKSEVAVRRRFPQYLKAIPTTPRSKKLHDGAVDAFLIAKYGEMLLS